MDTDSAKTEAFEGFSMIEPTEAWNSRLWEKIEKNPSSRKENSSNRRLMGMISFLLIINFFAFASNTLSSRKLAHQKELRGVANEFLISTNSSKY